MDHVDQVAASVSDKIGYGEGVRVPQKLDATPYRQSPDNNIIEFGNSGLSVRFDAGGNKIDFQPENKLYPEEKDILKYTFMLSTGLFELYKLLNDSDTISKLGIDQTTLTDIDISSNSRLVALVGSLLGKSNNKDLAKVDVEGGKGKIDLQAIKKLGPEDPLVEYLKKASTRSVGVIDVY